MNEKWGSHAIDLIGGCAPCHGGNYHSFPSRSSILRSAYLLTMDFTVIITTGTEKLISLSFPILPTILKFSEIGEKC